ncbi:chitin synthase chs-2-like [Oppia nitens]|uniref:chitin synthase chs-2-like n=1 Tax=Oppia nitens TaxID=1686743 RepID=UPI0023DBBE3A|nr:chitin synthase chs-2-like [Oppia nitens]
MWHEEHHEMQSLISSLFNLYGQHRALGLYNLIFQTHIFIDDAFDETFDLNGNKIFTINSYVMNLIDVSKQVNREMGYKSISLTQMDTPYGRQIHMHLDHNYKLVVHLKNRNFVRKGKRWSQVMYMNLVKTYVKINQLNESDVIMIALDGDTSYPPKSIFNIIDTAINNTDIGAISGKLIPISNQRLNWLVMYQKFEYAMSYWFQKTVENVWGSILCSPGCFTLYRAQAIFDVMSEYSTQSNDAFTQILYGQGEDRWLTTLLMKQGWIIDYCSQAVAYTYCPITLNEYIKQRLRWIASTMINNLQLMFISKEVTKYSRSVSWIYIAYHSCIFLISIITPLYILLIITKFFNTAFPFSQWILFSINLSIFVIYCLICIFARNDIQILVMKTLGIIYGLTMIAVFIITMYQSIVSDNVLTLTFVIFVSVCVVYTLAVLLHPGDLHMSATLLPALIYYACGPLMFMLLPIYSLINMNVVSWGTREKVNGSDANTSTNDTLSDLQNSCTQHVFTECHMTTTEADLWESLIIVDNSVLNPNQDNSQSTEDMKKYRQKLMTKQRNKYASVILTFNFVFFSTLFLVEYLVDKIHRYRVLWNYISDKPTILSNTDSQLTSSSLSNGIIILNKLTTINQDHTDNYVIITKC